MPRRRPVKKKAATKDFARWSLTFTKKIVIVCTAAWLVYTLFSAIMILYAIHSIGDFSFLDTFITDIGETFRLIVGVNIVSKTLENVFRYNNGGIFGTSIGTDGEPIGSTGDTPSD